MRLAKAITQQSFLRKRGPPPEGDGYLDSEFAEDVVDYANTTPLSTNNQAKNIVNSALIGTFTLTLSDKRLEALPIDVGNELLSSSSSFGPEDDGSGFIGERIQKLNVSKNFISNLEDWLSAVPNITCLDASHNQIECLPGFIGDVPIAELQITRNKISSM